MAYGWPVDRNTSLSRPTPERNVHTYRSWRTPDDVIGTMARAVKGDGYWWGRKDWSLKDYGEGRAVCPDNGVSCGLLVICQSMCALGSILLGVIQVYIGKSFVPTKKRTEIVTGWQHKIFLFKRAGDQPSPSFRFSGENSKTSLEQSQLVINGFQ